MYVGDYLKSINLIESNISDLITTGHSSRALEKVFGNETSLRRCMVEVKGSENSTVCNKTAYSNKIS